MKSLAVMLVASSFGLLGAMGCTEGGSDGGPASGDEQDVKSSSGSASCAAPVTVLRCLPGFEPSTAGCGGKSVNGFPAGRCLASDTDKIVGSYSVPNDQPDDLSFFALDLVADGTYSATGGCRPNPGGANCFAITAEKGIWSIEQSTPGQSSAPLELLLTDQFKQTTKLFYKIDGNKLSLTTTSGGKIGATFLKK